MTRLDRLLRAYAKARAARKPSRAIWKRLRDARTAALKARLRQPQLPGVA